jgi:hypothetical protein
VEESFICRLGEIQVCVQELLRLSVHLIVLGWRAGLGLLLSCLVEGLGSGGVVLGPLSSSLGIWLAELPLSFQVVDANSLLAPLPHVQNVTISQYSALVLPPAPCPGLPHPQLADDRQLSHQRAPWAREAHVPGPGFCQPVPSGELGGGGH